MCVCVCVMCVCVCVFQHGKELERLETEINPVLDDDPQVALSFLFGKVISMIKAVPDVS